MCFHGEAIQEKGFLAAESIQEVCANSRPSREMGLRALTYQAIPRRKHSSGRAFTILELLIVLVLLVAMLAIAWPQISRRIQRSDLKQVALKLKEEIADARGRAMETGTTWRLRFSELSNRYFLEPDSTFSTSDSKQSTILVGRKDNENPSQEKSDLSVETELDSAVLLSTMPRDKLVLGDSQKSLDEMETIQIGADDLGGDESGNMTEILLFPDGRATETTLRIIDTEANLAIELRVRGLTGLAELGDILKLDVGFERPEEQTNSDGQSSPPDVDDELDFELGA